MRLLTPTLLILLAVPVPLAAQEADESSLAPVQIREWDVPWPRTRPRDPDVAPDGRVWFVGQAGNYVAVLDPATGEMLRHDLDPGVMPHNVVVREDGQIFYAGNHAAHIGRMNAGSGAVDTLSMPDPGAADPHTLAFDSHGRVWFTVQGGAYVGRTDPATGETRLEKMPRGSRPYGIVVGDDDRPWVALFGTNRLVTLDPDDLKPRFVELPAPDARPRRLGLTSDGSVWYVDHARGTLGRMDPATGAVSERQTPGGQGSRPYAMAVDDADRVWFVETGSTPNRLVGFDPAVDDFVSVTPIPSGGGTVRHMVFHEPTRSLWFGTDTNTIGQARLP